jgi:hypothetical protein
MATVLPTETPQFAFADLTDFNAKLKAKQVPPGSVLLAGKNFGCGSSREQAVSALKGHELVIVAKGFARIFTQNSVNLGLRLVEGRAFTDDDDVDAPKVVIVSEAMARKYWPGRSALGERLYTEGFDTGQLGYASAVAWAMFAMIFLLTLLNYRFGSRYVND